MHPVSPTIQIDLRTRFPRLTHAPIVEAVIAFTARPERAWARELIEPALGRALPDYPVVEPQGLLHAEIRGGAAAPPAATVEDLGWIGFRVKSADGTRLAAFDRDGFRFSQLQPYDTWDVFEIEALRLWAIHKQLASPGTVERLGVRFINRIDLPPSASIADFLRDPPRAPGELELALAGSLDHRRFRLPGHPYAANLIRALDLNPALGTTAIVVDIDVYLQDVGDDHAELRAHLAKLRWLKNELFYSVITDEAVRRLS